MKNVGAAVLLLSGLFGFSASADLLRVDGVAAIVGEQVILRSELDLATDMMLRRIRAGGGDVAPDQEIELRMEALRALIDDRLILDLAERNEAAATDEEIDQAIQEIAREEGVQVEEIYRAAGAQGLGRRAYRQQLGMQMTRMRVVSGSVRSRIAVTDAEVRELFDERYAQARPGERVRVLHILLPNPPQTEPEMRREALGLAEKVRELALESGDFASVARRMSRAPTARQGGLTVFREGDAPPQLEEAFRQLVPGEISPVIPTEHGLNLFQLLDRFDPSDVQYEDVANQLRAELEDRQVEPEFTKFLDEVRKRQYIEIVNPNPR